MDDVHKSHGYAYLTYASECPHCSRELHFSLTSSLTRAAFYTACANDSDMSLLLGSSPFTVTTWVDSDSGSAHYEEGMPVHNESGRGRSRSPPRVVAPPTRTPRAPPPTPRPDIVGHYSMIQGAQSEPAAAASTAPPKMTPPPGPPPDAMPLPWEPDDGQAWSPHDEWQQWQVAMEGFGYSRSWPSTTKDMRFKGKGKGKDKDKGKGKGKYKLQDQNAIVGQGSGTRVGEGRTDPYWNGSAIVA